MGFRVEGLAFGVQGSGLWCCDLIASGFKVQSLGLKLCRAWEYSGFGINSE